MDIAFTEQDRSFQKEVSDWLETAWPKETRDKQSKSALGKLSKDDLVSWQKKLAEKGGQQLIGGRTWRSKFHAHPKLYF